MEGLIVNQFELLFQYVDGVKEIESHSIQQVALIKLSFFPGTDMGSAEGEVVAMANRAMARMPPGTLPPMIMRMDEGSVPGRLPGADQQNDAAGAGGRLCAERDPSAGAIERAGHSRRLAVRPERAHDPGERRSAAAA